MTDTEWKEIKKLSLQHGIEYPVIFVMECEKRKLNPLTILRTGECDSITLTGVVKYKLEDLINEIKYGAYWP